MHLENAVIYLSMNLGVMNYNTSLLWIGSESKYSLIISPLNQGSPKLTTIKLEISTLQKVHVLYIYLLQYAASYMTTLEPCPKGGMMDFIELLSTKGDNCFVKLNFYYNVIIYLFVFRCLLLISILLLNELVHVS